MCLSYAEAEDFLRAKNEGYILTGEIEIKFSDYVPGGYIYAKMRLREPLLKTKAEFELQCKNVQLIIGYTREGLERRIFNAIYIFGKSMRQVAKETGYTLGYCANVESTGIKKLIRNKNVALLLP